ncbi:MAG: family 16 glycosylhydrolase [Spirochaetia bacterium]|nr:family 16 glycosylhydrolase [Spirochaetia bacterium]
MKSFFKQWLAFAFLAGMPAFSQEPSEKPEASYKMSLRASEALAPNKPYTVPRGFHGPEWRESGKYSALLGPSYWTEEGEDPTATWNPDLRTAGSWRVSFWKVFTGTSGDDAKAPFIIHCGSVQKRVELDLSKSPAEWLVLGTWDFKADRDEYVEVRPGPQKSKKTRLGEMKFERVNASGAVLETIVVDLARILPAPPFSDFIGHPNRGELVSLWRKNILVPAARDRFDSGNGMTAGELVLLTLRASGDTNTRDEKEAFQKASRMGLLASTPVPFEQKNLSQKANRSQGRALFAALAKKIGKEISPEELFKLVPGLVEDGELSRTQAHLLARRFLHRVAYAGPKPEASWKKVFDETFKGTDLDMNEWISANGPSGHIASSRWKENAIVSNGQLHLVQRKENRGGQEWTSGSVWTKKQWQYGYMECSYRYAAASGINQSFWMFSDPRVPRVELDQNEGLYPDTIRPHYIIHPKGAGWVGDAPRPKVYGDKTIHAGENLAEDFHVYGLYWDEKELIYYFDGVEIHRIPNELAHAPVAVYLSTAIFAGATGHGNPAAHGTSMDVEWVSVWQK